MFKKKLFWNQKKLLQIPNCGREWPMGPYLTSLAFDNSLSVPRAELRPRLQKKFSKHPSKKFLFLKFLNLSTGLPQRRLPPKITAWWRYRLPIKTLTPNYNSQFLKILFFVLRRKPANTSKCVWIGPKDN